MTRTNTKLSKDIQKKITVIDDRLERIASAKRTLINFNLGDFLNDMWFEAIDGHKLFASAVFAHCQLIKQTEIADPELHKSLKNNLNLLIEAHHNTMSIIEKYIERCK